MHELVVYPVAAIAAKGPRWTPEWDARGYAEMPLLLEVLENLQSAEDPTNQMGLGVRVYRNLDTMLVTVSTEGAIMAAFDDDLLRDDTRVTIYDLIDAIAGRLVDDQLALVIVPRYT